MELGSVLNKLQKYIDANILNNKNAFIELFTEYKTKEVGSNIDVVVNVGNHIDNVDNVSVHSNQVDNVSSNMNEVINVSTNISSVVATSNHITSVNTVSNHIDKVDTVNNNIDDVSTVANYINEGSSTGGGQYLGQGIPKPVEYLSNVLKGDVVLEENLSAMAIDHLVIDDNSSFTVKDNSVFKII
jgi:hypothetical protein